MVFPTCSSVSSWSGVGSGCSINIAYNKQIPVCPSVGSQTTDKQGNQLCRPPEALCIADPNFKFDLSMDGKNDVRRMRFYVVARPHECFRLLFRSPFLPSSTTLQVLFSCLIPLSHHLSHFRFVSGIQTWMVSRTCWSSPRQQIDTRPSFWFRNPVREILQDAMQRDEDGVDSGSSSTAQGVWKQ